MQDNIKLLAQEAGFCFFTAEEDADEPIDWSCDYEEEFEKFIGLLKKQTRKELVAEVVNLLRELHSISYPRHNYYLCAANLIQEDFKETND